MTLEYELVDDGTLDTVVDVHCTECGHDWTERIYASEDYYDEGGFLDLVALMEEADVECEQCDD